jgi:predicted nuclease of predicted toxin-antitoxin system
VRLLLDEHYSPRIAEELRNRGHDVVSLGERQDVRGLDDRELWNRASAEKRAVLTENVADFMPLVREAAAGGEPHFGVIFTSPRSLPRGAGTIGIYVERLDRFLRDRPSDDALMDQVYWLGPN